MRKEESMMCLPRKFLLPSVVQCVILGLFFASGCSDSTTGPDDPGNHEVGEFEAPSMVNVSAGTFTMGDGFAVCGFSEHEVTLTRAVYLGQHEVTNDEYTAGLQWAYDHGYVAATTASVRDNLDGSTVVLMDLSSSWAEIQFDSGSGSFYVRESPSTQAQSAYPGGYDPSGHPARLVKWHGAARFCDWLSLLEGLPRAYQHSGDWSCNGGDPYGATGYRLPADAEWEYAAQYNDDRVFPWGNETPDCSDANFAYAGNSCIGWTSPVGSYAAAPASLGLSDMAGNAYEWCNDWLECNLGAVPVTDPVGPATGSWRVTHGGSYYNFEGDLRCSGRDIPNDGGIDDRCAGFRVARTATP